MAPKGGRVIAGVYPRRMGKSTFLATLASFLGVLGVKPRAQREVVFKQCAVYDTDYLFFEEHFGRYHVLKLDFKGNEYLYKGVLVGVFDIRYTGLGSGLNNVEVYLAHSGMAGVPGQRNPFEKAFGFTAQDAWSLINDYVDNQWPHRANYPSTAGFKRDLFRGCFEHFDGYRIGKVHNIFNPHTLLQFIRSLDDVTSPDTVSFEGRG
ncbi:hypothetical protein IWW50_001211 [Coemansia erecta]|nr:hypothetical protein IWW50_001211 [Coemansia erecta]